MEVNTYLQILRDIKDVAFATVDANGMPQVRIIDIMIVENEKIYFCTSRGKDFHQQLLQNNNVAITGMNKNYQMVRVSGKAQRLDSNNYWIDRIFEENPSMNDVYPGESRYILDAFCIQEGEGEFFDLSVSPITRYSFSLNKKPVTLKGFEISDACIGCGKCRRNCPQQCIVEGKPYQIIQEHCLHCGLCYENCPVQAILRRRTI